MSIRRLIDYLYYRCAKGYAFWGDPDPELMGRALASLPIGFNILSIVYLVLFFLKVRISGTQLIMLLSFIYAIVMFVIVRAKPLKMAEKQFANDIFKRRNSIIICVYYILSIVIFVVCNNYLPRK